MVAEVDEVALPGYIRPFFLKGYSSSSGRSVHFVESGEVVEHVVEPSIEPENLVVTHLFYFEAGFASFVDEFSECLG